MRTVVMKHGWLIFCLLAVTFFVAAVLFIVGQVQRAEERRLSELTNEGALYESLAVQKGQEYTVKPDTRIEKSVSFTSCGHTITSGYSPSPELVGMDKEAVGEAFPDFRVTGFVEGEISLARTADMYCPQHYVLKKNGDTVELLCSTPDGNLQVLKNIEISLNNVSNELYAEFLSGKAYNSIIELEEALEDIAS